MVGVSYLGMSDSYPQSTPPLDLDRYSERTRRYLYDLLRVSFFTCSEAAPDQDDPFPYSAEDAGLSIYFVLGRWFATWTSLEVETYRPEHQRVEVLRIKPSNENDFGVMLDEC